jgi:perosamine synthetase
MTQHQVVPKIYQNLHINFDESDKEAVARSFNSRSFSGKSPIIADYEKVIADYFGSAHALACCNGTVAIELALRGLGLAAGDKVALPPTAPIMTVLPIITMACEPIFCDVKEADFAPDLEHLDALVEAGVKALIVVPMWGYPLDMAPVAAFCRARGIGLIEDCAHAFGTRIGGRPLGTFGDVSTFSTHERKLVSTGEGGFCLTDNSDVHARMLAWQHHGLAVSKRNQEYRLGEGIGTNFKLSPLCAALGINQFRKLDAKIAARRQRVERLRSALSGLPGIVELTRFGDEEINGYAMVYRCRQGSSCTRVKTLTALSRTRVHALFRMVPESRGHDRGDIHHTLSRGPGRCRPSIYCRRRFRCVRGGLN